MANPEHLEILKRGVEEWNRWREEDSEVRPDLEGANLLRAQLTDADLTRATLTRATLIKAELGYANLISANLANANLTRTNLLRAHLTDANLTNANLTGAFLHGANLTSADLTSANLTHADLTYANLTRARLTDADLTGSRTGFTTFANIDLREVRGLDGLGEKAPSTIGTNTLQRSAGQIPEHFLKGCGLTDWEIESAKLYDPDLDEDEVTTILYEITRIRGQQPFAMSRVFISYTRTDEPFVKALEKRFDEKGVRYWRDIHDLKAGRVERQIDRAITLYPLVLLVLSERSVLSDWVEWEASKARDLEREHQKAGEPRDVLCPVALDDAWKTCDWPGPLRRQIEDYLVLDFSGWESDSAKMERQFTRLYEGLVLNYGKKSGE